MDGWFKIVVWLAVVLGGTSFIVERTLLEVWRVPTDDPLLAASIEPTLSAGDLVLVTRHGSPSRGELQRCADPQAPGRYVVARAIGSGGEKVDVKNEDVSVDGYRNPSPRSCDSVTLHDPRTGDDVDLLCRVQEFSEMSFSVLEAAKDREPPATATVDLSRWYLVSDDRHVHLDSRDFGQVDAASCQHVVFRLVSAAGFGDAKKRLTVIW
ncbi:MAG TPA: S26 family signal peptidase [Polyangiaceae bacterium]|jgi:signal peptidase I